MEDKDVPGASFQYSSIQKRSVEQLKTMVEMQRTQREQKDGSVGWKVVFFVFFPWLFDLCYLFTKQAYRSGLSKTNIDEVHCSEF